MGRPGLRIARRLTYEEFCTAQEQNIHLEITIFSMNIMVLMEFFGRLLVVYIATQQAQKRDGRILLSRQ
jgi:hypothetical protein